MVFPFDFGFIPSTLGRDGDPLDVMVLMDEPAHVGCLVDVRIIGVIEAKQTQDGRRKATIGYWRWRFILTSISLEELNP
jgi:inorganic pyrophosphatase